jgi:Holliday junction resolvasome RuvABC endonuclease subunit
LSFEFIGLDTASSRVHSVHQRYEDGEFKVLDTWEFHAANKDSVDVRRSELYRSCVGYFDLLSLKSPGCQVFCEEPISGRSGKTTRILCLAAGAIWAAHLDFDLFWHWIDIAHWKKQVVGNGNAKKPQIQEWSMKHGGKKAWEEDHHDAHAIGVSGAKDVAALDSAF